jgi:hypothetical protein
MTSMISRFGLAFLGVAATGMLTVSAFTFEPVKHAFFAAGSETFIVDETGKETWKYPHSSRDGWVLDNGNILLALSTSKTYPGGAAVEVDRNGKLLFEFKGTQSELNTIQAVGDGIIMLTEAGNKPRIIEVGRDGKILAEVPLQAGSMTRRERWYGK